MFRKCRFKGLMDKLNASNLSPWRFIDQRMSKKRNVKRNFHCKFYGRVFVYEITRLLSVITHPLSAGIDFGARERAAVDRIFPLEYLPPRLINHKYTVLLVYDLEVDSISYLCYKKSFGEHCLRMVQIADCETTRGEKNR